MSRCLLHNVQNATNKPYGSKNASVRSFVSLQYKIRAAIRDRTRDLKIFSLTLSQLSYYSCSCWRGGGCSTECAVVQSRYSSTTQPNTSCLTRPLLSIHLNYHTYTSRITLYYCGTALRLDESDIYQDLNWLCDSEFTCNHQTTRPFYGKNREWVSRS